MGLFLALQAAAPTPAPPADWSALPPLRLTTTPDYAALMTPFVHGEVAGGRCPTGGKSAVTIDLALLVSKTGDVLRIVPRAINCPTVEQFAAGVVQKAARGNLAGAAPASDSWYRTGMTLNW
ncbi:MAG: hypothetical protein E7773_13505 [Sphingomonas sp.]|nr:MAG: hypothetical protein E7773_13505 [Sphingomonas sp.]